LAITAFVTLTPLVSAASEQDRVSARSAAEEGNRAFAEGRYEDAVRFYQKAESLYHAPSNLLLLARAHEAQGHLVLAQEAYVAIVNENLPPNAPKPFLNAQSAARTELQELKGRIPKLTLSVAEEYPDLAVTIDGQPLALAALGVPKPIDPGEHVVVVTARGKVRAERRVTVAEGARESLTVELEDDASAPPVPVAAQEPAKSSADSVEFSGNSTELSEPSSRSTLGYALLGGGVLFVGVGSYFGIAAKSQRDDALDDDALCGGDACSEDGREEIDAATLKAHIATGGFALGAAALGVGAYLLLTGNENSSEVGFVPVVSPHAVGLSYGGTL
jgi:tetratricopeptide (TPR) repeat protein